MNCSELISYSLLTIVLFAIYDVVKDYIKIVLKRRETLLIKKVLFNDIAKMKKDLKKPEEYAFQKGFEGIKSGTFTDLISHVATEYGKDISEKKGFKEKIKYCFKTFSEDDVFIDILGKCLGDTHPLFKYMDEEKSADKECKDDFCPVQNE